MKITPFLFTFFFPFRLFSQTIWHVAATSATPFPDGLSWSTAFPDLHQALAAAQSGDEVWIAQGTYKPTTGNDRLAVFKLSGGVALYGGFNGTETQRDQRDWIQYPAILSGDIGVPGDSTDNSFGVIYAASTNASTLMDGLTIEEGNADNPDINVPYNSPTRSGGGVYLDGRGAGNSVRLSFSNCTFRRNRAGYQGGGIFADGRDNGEAIIRLDNCIFDRNRALYNGAAFAVENNTVQSGPMDVQHCVFTGHRGSVAWMNTYQDITFSDCYFSQNQSPAYGVIIIEGENKQYPITIRRCDFIENSPGTSSHILVISLRNSTNKIPVQISHCRFYGNLGLTGWIYGGTNASGKFHVLVDHCLFHLNYSTSASFYLSNFGVNDEAMFSNCLFQGNSNALIVRSPLNSKPARIVNSILISNVQNSIVYGDALVENCIFNKPGCAAVGPNITCGSGNLFATDPLFLNANPTPGADFRLQPCSPAINAGNDAVLDSLGLDFDLDGNPRIRHGRSDIGLYEANLLSITNVAPPSCSGADDGSITFSPHLCPPYQIGWSGGVVQDTVLPDLPAGNYTLTATDVNGLEFLEQVKVEDPEPVAVLFDAVDISCFGYSDGAITLLPAGGTPPYQFSQGNPIPDLPAGVYAFTVTDVNGCTGSIENISLSEPPPIQILYSVQNTSGPNTADGAILIDTVFGGNGGIITPPDLSGLLPGTYTITVTDAGNCFASETVEVGYTLTSGEPAGNMEVTIYPNPATSGVPALITCGDSSGGRASILDARGKRLKEMVIRPGGATPVGNAFPTGLYFIHFLSESGQRAVLRWVVL